MSEKIVPVLLCGGAGTRLWPLSRAGTPKQLLALAGAETMLQQTAARVPREAGFDAPLIIAGESQAAGITAQLAEAGIADYRLILEPTARNTAPAIALAALEASPDALLLVMPSDHVIADDAAFRLGVEAGTEWARQGWLVTFGIEPTRPETGYGYIKRGAELGGGAWEAEHFVEKPDLGRAQGFLAEGGYAWNAGIFLFRASAFLAALEAYAPQILAAAISASAEARRDGLLIRPDAGAFAAAPSRSVDHAVMEHADRIALVPLAMGWSDVGSFEALHEVSERDEADNAAAGDVVAIDTSGCLIRSDGPLVVAIGVKDLVVVATAETVLVVPRSESQRVREAVALLSQRGDGRL